MKLYHGTNSRFLESILARGLLPRGNEFPNQFPEQHTRSDLVYLTKCFGPVYAQNATRGTDDRWLIVEVEIPFKELHQLLPDEAYGAALAELDGEPPHRIIEIEKEYRTHLENHQGDWKSSLDTVGNVAYKPTSRPAAITRSCLFDPLLRHEFVSTFVEAVRHTSLPHDVLLPYFSDVTAWLFGDTPHLPTPPVEMQEGIGSMITHESNDRGGIRVERR